MGKKQLDNLELLKMNQYYIEKLGWNCLGLHPSKIMGVMEDSEVWLFNLELRHPQPSPKKGQGRKRGFSLKFSMVLFASLLFVLLKLHRTNFSFHLPVSSSIIFN